MTNHEKVARATELLEEVQSHLKVQLDLYNAGESKGSITPRRDDDNGKAWMAVTSAIAELETVSKYL